MRLFEAGHVYEAENGNSLEPKRLCLGATGHALPLNVNRPPESRPITFFDIKGDVEDLLSAFSSTVLHYDAQTSDYYHPGRSARAVMDGNVVAQLGQLHPDAAALRKLRQDVFLAELYLDRLYEHDLRKPNFEPLPRYPAVERDFSFVFGDGVSFEQIERAVGAMHLKELRSFTPGEIFRGGAIAAGRGRRRG